MIKGLEHFFFDKILRELGLFSLEKALGRLYNSLSISKTGLDEIWGGTVLGIVAIGQGIIVLNQKGGNLD